MGRCNCRSAHEGTASDRDNISGVVGAGSNLDGAARRAPTSSMVSGSIANGVGLPYLPLDPHKLRSGGLGRRFGEFAQSARPIMETMGAAEVSSLAVFPRGLTACSPPGSSLGPARLVVGAHAGKLGIPIRQERRRS